MPHLPRTTRPPHYARYKIEKCFALKALMAYLKFRKNRLFFSESEPPKTLENVILVTFLNRSASRAVPAKIACFIRVLCKKMRCEEEGEETNSLFQKSGSHFWRQNT